MTVKIHLTFDKPTISKGILEILSQNLLEDPERDVLKISLKESLAILGKGNKLQYGPANYLLSGILRALSLEDSDVLDEITPYTASTQGDEQDNPPQGPSSGPCQSTQDDKERKIDKQSPESYPSHKSEPNRNKSEENCKFIDEEEIHSDNDEEFADSNEVLGMEQNKKEQNKKEQKKGDDPFVSQVPTHNSQASDNDADKRRVCPDFIRGKCPKGIKGRECQFRHPRLCKRFLQGGRSESGCKNWGRDPDCRTDPGKHRILCPLLHPQICRNSYLFGSCKRAGCRERHLPQPQQLPTTTSNNQLQPQTSQNSPESQGKSSFLWQREMQERMSGIEAILLTISRSQHTPSQAWNLPSQAPIQVWSHQSQVRPDVQTYRQAVLQQSDRRQPFGEGGK